MWQFYKEKKYLIVSIIILFLDGIIVYYMPSYFNKLNYFYPMLTISFISFLSFRYQDNYFIIIFLGLMYDLLYSNILFYNIIIFLLLSIINTKIKRYFKSNLLLFIIITIFNICLYDSISFILVLLTDYQSVSIMDLLYKFSHSIVLNIMSVFVFFFLFKKDLRYA